MSILVDNTGWIGDFLPGSTVVFYFYTNDRNGVQAQLSGTPTARIFKGTQTSSASAGVTLVNSGNGFNTISITTNSDTAFYASGNDYAATISVGNVSGVSVSGTVVGTFSINNRSIQGVTSLAQLGVNVVTLGGTTAQTSTASIGVNLITWRDNQPSNLSASGNVPSNVAQWAAEAVLTPTVLGVPIVSAGYWGTSSIPVANVRPDISVIRTATAQAGSNSTITLDSSASSTDNLYLNEIVVLTSGTGTGQSAIISSYVGSTRVATISGAWATTPASGTVFGIIARGLGIATLASGVNVTQWQGSSPNALVSGLVPTSSSGGSVSNVSGSVASITSGVNVTQWLGSPPNPLVSGLVATSASGGSVAAVAGSVASITSGVNVTQWLGSPPNALVSGLVASSTSGGSVGVVTSLTSGVNVSLWQGSQPAPLVQSLVQAQVSGTPTVVISQTFPTNFASLSITGGGAVTVGTNQDKTGYSLTSGEETNIANAVWDNPSGIETNVTPRQALRYIAAAEVGVTSGALTNTFTISAISAAGTTRLTATTDASGNRSAVVLS